jgi:hypothetical protein
MGIICRVISHYVFYKKLSPVYPQDYPQLYPQAVYFQWAVDFATAHGNLPPPRASMVNRIRNRKRISWKFTLTAALQKLASFSQRQAHAGVYVQAEDEPVTLWVGNSGRTICTPWAVFPRDMAAEDMHTHPGFAQRGVAQRGVAL